MPSWSIERLNERVARLTCDGKSNASKTAILFISDLHIDSAQCDRRLLLRHLAQAVEKESPIIMTGDIFDAMQGKWDPRSSQSSFRPEHRGDNYLDLLVETTAETLRPFAKNIAFISEGNHETAIKKRHQTDLIQRLCHELRKMGSPVLAGGYDGWIQTRVNYTRESGENVDIKYHHGAGGGGEVTRGMIDHSRTARHAMADIYIQGHIHRRNLEENIIECLTSKGTWTLRKQYFLRASTYKRETKGFHVEKGLGPRPLGGWWLHLEPHASNGKKWLDYYPTPTDGF